MLLKHFDLQSTSRKVMEGLVKDARPLLTVLLPVPLPLVLQFLLGLLPQVCTLMYCDSLV